MSKKKHHFFRNLFFKLIALVIAILTIKPIREWVMKQLMNSGKEK